MRMQLSENIFSCRDDAIYFGDENRTTSHCAMRDDPILNEAKTRSAES